jgi:hypothetical protein
MIPAPFYELLPYIYVLVGALATFGIEAILGKICGVLMIPAPFYELLPYIYVFGRVSHIWN